MNMGLKKVFMPIFLFEIVNLSERPLPIKGKASASIGRDGNKEADANVIERPLDAFNDIEDAAICITKQSLYRRTDYETNG